MTDNSSIRIEMTDPDLDSGYGWPTSWQLSPSVYSDGEINQADFTERVAAALVAGKFSVTVTHRSETTKRLR
jgi:hypothetical protein